MYETREREKSIRSEDQSSERNVSLTKVVFNTKKERKRAREGGRERERDREGERDGKGKRKFRQRERERESTRPAVRVGVRNNMSFVLLLAKEQGADHVDMKVK